MWNWNNTRWANYFVVFDAFDIAQMIFDRLKIYFVRNPSRHNIVIYSYDPKEIKRFAHVSNCFMCIEVAYFITNKFRTGKSTFHKNLVPVVSICFTFICCYVSCLTPITHWAKQFLNEKKIEGFVPIIIFFKWAV